MSRKNEQLFCSQHNKLEFGINGTVGAAWPEATAEQDQRKPLRRGLMKVSGPAVDRGCPVGACCQLIFSNSSHLWCDTTIHRLSLCPISANGNIWGVRKCLRPQCNWVGGGRKKGDGKLYLSGKENGGTELRVPSLIICSILYWFMTRHTEQSAAGSIRSWPISPSVSSLGITIGVLAWMRLVNNVSCQTN